MLRRIFEPKRDEVAGENCVMRNFIICPMIKSRNMRWAEHVAHGRNEKCVQNFGWKT
jgi:hypothetical protein